MKQPFLKYFIALLLVGGIASSSISCKKDDDDNNNTPAKTKTEILTSHAWKVNSWTIDPPYDNGDGTFTSDRLADMEACDKDNFITFQADGKLLYDEGTQKCDPDDPQTDPGTWALLDNETKMSIDGLTLNVKSFEENKIELTDSFEEDGTTYNETITLVKN